MKAQLENNKEKACYIQDPDGFQMYVEVQPGKRPQHKLQVQLSKHPESELETFHCTISHFPNNGIRAEMATAITLKWGTEDNERQDDKWERLTNGPAPMALDTYTLG